LRRLVVVAAAAAGSGRELGDAVAWLGTLPTAGVSLAGALPEVRWDEADVLWIRGAAEPDPRLLPWLHAGGRLLATLDAALLPVALGLESRAPVTITLPQSLPGDFGLAAFGPHPLFTGLRDCAVLRPPSEPADRALRCYDGVRPERGAVVAVERRGLELQPARVLAWEFAVGAGGVLCLAFHPSLLPDDPAASRGDAELVLANALVGEAVPHRDRAAPVALWPASGCRSIGADAVVPMLVAPTDPWPPSSLPRLDLIPAAGWTHAGRRLLVSVRASTGRREVWVPPFRVMHAAAVRDAIPCAPGHLAADEIAGGLALGGHRLLERWAAAPDVPVAVWEIAGQDGIEVVVEWEVDLRRGWPFPAGSYGDLTFAAAADGRSLRVEAAAGPAALFAVAGGTLTADESDDAPVVRVTCAGTTPLRIVAAAGVDAEELERAVRALGREGVRGMVAARARKAAQLERYGTAFEAPDELLARGFAWARQRGDESVVGAPGVGRSVLDPCPAGAGDEAWCFGTHACAAAAAQLIAGHRDPARELLRFLAQTQHPDGGIAAHFPLGGLSSMPETSSTVVLLELAERFLAWTGDLDALRRLRTPIARAVEWLAGRADKPPVLRERVLEAVEWVAGSDVDIGALAVLRRHSVGEPRAADVAAHAVVEAAAAALRRAPGTLPGTGAAPALLEAVAALWGLEPDAQEATLGLAPIVPPGWAGFALRRLRVGRTILDLEVRRRPQAIVLRTAHLFGPRLVLTVVVRVVQVESSGVDDIPLAATRARFEAHGRHEVRFLLRESP